MKEEWLFPGAAVPVDMETTAALVAEIKRLIDVVGGMALAQPAQEPVAWLCTPDEDGLFDLPLADKGCKDCFPVYTTPPQPAQEPVCPECKAGVLYECVACSSNNYPAQPAQEKNT